MTENELLQQIERDEKVYKRVLDFTARAIVSSGTVKIVLIAGPSCAGKTTTSRIIQQHLHNLGKNTYVVSLDDFYLNPCDTPRWSDGTPDFETIYSLDLPLLHDCLQSLCEGKPTVLPTFDFVKHARGEETRLITLGADDICVVEGLHALNPLIYSGSIDEKYLYKIYLDSYQSVNRRTQSRMLRRLVRDYLYRDAPAEQTFDLWDNVVAGEKKYIRPYEHLADTCINTYFPYETGVLKAHAMSALSKLPEDSKYLSLAKRTRKYLENVQEVNSEWVPEDSLLQEFIP